MTWYFNGLIANRQIVRIRVVN